MGAVNTIRDAELFDRKSEKREIANADFRYIQSQQSLKTDFRVRKSSECGSGAPMMIDNKIAENGDRAAAAACGASSVVAPPPRVDDAR